MTLSEEYSVLDSKQATNSSQPTDLPFSHSRKVQRIEMNIPSEMSELQHLMKLLSNGFRQCY